MGGDKIMGILLAFILVMIGSCIGFALCALMVVARNSDTISHDLANRLHEKDIAKKMLGNPLQ